MRHRTLEWNKFRTGLASEKVSRQAREQLPLTFCEYFFVIRWDKIINSVGFVCCQCGGSFGSGRTSTCKNQKFSVPEGHPEGSDQFTPKSKWDQSDNRDSIRNLCVCVCVNSKWSPWLKLKSFGLVLILLELLKTRFPENQATPRTGNIREYNPLGGHIHILQTFCIRSFDEHFNKFVENSVEIAKCTILYFASVSTKAIWNWTHTLLIGIVLGLSHSHEITWCVTNTYIIDTLC